MSEKVDPFEGVRLIKCLKERKRVQKDPEVGSEEDPRIDTVVDKIADALGIDLKD